MRIFNYDGTTGEYLGEGVADADPLAGVNEKGEPNNWLFPANSTTMPPPVATPGNVTVFRKGKWGYVRISDGAGGDDSDTPHAPSVADVVTQREMRLQTSFQYNFHDERGVHIIGTTKEDMMGWDEVTKLASALILSGMPDTEIAIKTFTGPVMVTAAEWQHILIRAGEVRQPIFAASFALQAMDPIPDDYADDKWWPATPPMEIPTE